MKLIPSGDAILRTPSRELTSEEISEITKNHGNFVKFMKQNGGIGLAANQIGDARQYFVWDFGMVFNPKILNHGNEKIVMQEGCLSFPGKLINVERPRVIDVEYIDERGVLCKKTLKGIPARIFQHETDHLKGICIV
jgi:peptide deformylase